MTVRAWGMGGESAPCPSPTVGTGTGSGKSSKVVVDWPSPQPSPTGRGGFAEVPDRGRGRRKRVGVGVVYVDRIHPRPAPSGAHKRRPYTWSALRSSVSRPRPTVGTGSSPANRAEGVVELPSPRPSPTRRGGRCGGRASKQPRWCAGAAPFAVSLRTLTKPSWSRVAFCLEVGFPRAFSRPV